MAKQILIEDCKDCPFLIEFYGEINPDNVYKNVANCDFSGYRCSKLNKIISKTKEKIIGIKKECPLTDYISEEKEIISSEQK